MITALRHAWLVDPPFGNDFVYTQRAGIVSRVCSVVWMIVFDATVITRRPYLVLRDAAGVLVSADCWSLCPGTAGTTPCFIADEAYTLPEATFTESGFPWYRKRTCLKVLLPGWTLASAVQNLQAGDIVQQIDISFEDVNLVAVGSVS